VRSQIEASLIGDYMEYKELGFKCGLEIHQRLATAEKLFCSCNAIQDKGDEIGNVSRFLKPVAGELGKLDFATRFEAEKKNKFIYNIYRNSTCLVDIDEEPPHEINTEALRFALKVAKALHAKIPDEIWVMRKEVVDGSDPTGFQRTMLIGYNGYIIINGKKVTIDGIYLEEEASGIVEKGDGYIIYDPSRLGIPLVEIDTAPVLLNPQEAKEAALKIGLILRLLGVAQRGIGSIRQDVNVSISNGARVEIKGFQEVAKMDKIIENEVSRQLALISIMQLLKERNARIDKVFDITDLLINTNSKIIKKGIENKGVVLALKLINFKGILGFDIGKIRFGTDVSAYAKIAGVNGIIHSDEDLSSYGFSNEEINKIREKMHLNENDSFLLVVAPKEKAERAIELAKYRIELAFNEVPKETRAADNELFITRFMRPLPGGSRMYPETDVAPISAKDIDIEYIDVDELIAKIKSEIMNDQIAEQLLWSRLLPLYLELRNSTKIKPNELAILLTNKENELNRDKKSIEDMPMDTLIYLFDLYSKEEITRRALEYIIDKMPMSKEDVDNIIKNFKLHRIKGDELKELIEKYKASKNIIEDIMKDYRLNIDPNELRQLIK